MTIVSSQPEWKYGPLGAVQGPRPSARPKTECKLENLVRVLASGYQEVTQQREVEKRKQTVK